VIRCARETAVYTGENSLSFAITFINTTTYGTGTRSVARIHHNNRDTNHMSLVFYKVLKLVKRPAMQSSSLGFSNRNPMAYAGKFFYGNRPLCALSLFYNAFADNMIYVFGKTSFPARQFLEKTFSRFRSLLLQFASKSSMAVSDIIYLIAREHVTITGDRNVDNAKINPQHPFYINGIRIVNVASCQQVEAVTEENEIALTLLASEKLTLSLATSKGNMEPTVKCPNGDGGSFQIISQDTGVVSYPAVDFECSLNASACFVRISNFCNTAYSHLCRQAKAFANGIVDQLMETVLSEDLFLPSNVTDVITSLIRCLQCQLQRLGLFFGWLEFDLCGKFHAVIIALNGNLVKYRKGAAHK